MVRTDCARQGTLVTGTGLLCILADGQRFSGDITAGGEVQKGCIMNRRLLPLLLVAVLAVPILLVSGSLSTSDVSLGTASAAGDVLDAVEVILGDVYEVVAPSVVNIQVVQSVGDLPSGHPDIPAAPEDPSIPSDPFGQQGLGSGFVWDKAGHIVTNNHVVEGATRVTVTFYDDTAVPAEVVGTDPNSDLAVLQVEMDAEDLVPVKLADSTEVKVGQLAAAVGNPFGLEGTMTVGFVSALGRSLPVASTNMLAPSYTIPDIIQTDAPINPGNSGGVLVDSDGFVIGVPTAIESPVRANAGIGFAVPAVIVQKIVPALIEDGAYAHPWLGISGTSLTSGEAEARGMDADQRGALIIEVLGDSPAAEAGLQGDDLIVAIGDQPVKEFEDLVAYLARYSNVGESVRLTVLRDGRQRMIEVTLAARPVAEASSNLPAAPVAPAAGGAWLGIQGLTLTPEIAEAAGLPAGQEGVLVAEVIRNTPADEAGLRGGDQVIDINGQQIQVGGDVILAAEGEPVRGFEDLRGFLLRAEPGQEVTFTLLRDGDEITVEVTLGERPASTP
jgi:S1-C subfamily serine protease